MNNRGGSPGAFASNCRFPAEQCTKEESMRRIFVLSLLSLSVVTMFMVITAADAEAGKTVTICRRLEPRGPLICFTWGTGSEVCDIVAKGVSNKVTKAEQKARAAESEKETAENNLALAEQRLEMTEGEHRDEGLVARVGDAAEERPKRIPAIL